MILIIIVIIAIILVYLFTLWGSQKVKNNVMVAFTGQMGSGKTYHAVKHAIKTYKRRKMMKVLRILKIDDPVVLYSNMPILIKKERKLFGKIIIKEQWATVLTREHLLLQSRMTEHCVIVLDEISNFASQWDYDNPNCQVIFADWLRYCRHYFDPRIFITAQASGEILIDARRKLSSCYNLDNMRRFLIFFYKVDVTEVQFTEEITTITTPHEDIDQKPYFFGTLPFKYLTFFNKIFFPFGYSHYDSRCYSENYPVLGQDAPLDNWYEYKTSYEVDLTPTIEQVKEYKESKKGVRKEFVKKYIPKSNKDV